jgi:glyoxylase-like metal-dependent hydrolase (beta-lactamase superfamily II)
MSKIPVSPEDIQLIILTHGDFDHVGSAKDIKALSGARVAIHNLDRLNFERPVFNFPPGVAIWGRFLHLILYPITKMIFKIPTEKADIVLDNEDYPLNDFGISGKIVYTPGHTKGLVSVLLDSGDAFVGCLAHNNLPFCLRPGLPIFAEDIDKVKESWKLIIKQVQKKIIRLMAIHFRWILLKTS